MRIVLPLAALLLSGCAIQSKELERPQVAARYDSTKSAKDFAVCAAEGMGRRLENEGNRYVIKHVNGVQVQARWDFLATLEGSQAELRAPASYDAGEAIVRECAG